MAGARLPPPLRHTHRNLNQFCASTIKSASVYERDKFGVENIQSQARHAACHFRLPPRDEARSYASSLAPRRILSILFALAGLRYAIHNWHHPYDPSPLAAPLLGIAILLGAWNRFSRRRE